MKSILRLFIVISIMMATSLYLKVSRADIFTTGQGLVDICNVDQNDASDPTRHMKKTGCAGYISGVIRGAQMVFDAYPESRFFCLPDNEISSKDQIIIINKTLKENPEFLKKLSQTVILFTFMNEYPCK